MRAARLTLLGVVLLGACSSNEPGDGVHPTPSVAPSSAAVSPSPGPAAESLIGVIGDFGYRPGAAPSMVAVLKEYAREHAPSGRFAAVVTTGDNAYDRGTAAQAAWARHVLEPLLTGRTRLVASLGNHDELTDGGRPVMARFGMPGRWYATVVGPVQLVVLDANRTGDAGQLRWLRRTLAAPRAVPFRVAVFHQPAAACSFHTADVGVDRRFLPLLDRVNGHGVDLVLSGHNHSYERFVDRHGLPLVTTGGGGATVYPSSRVLCTGPARPLALHSTYNVVVLSVAADGLRLVALDRKGRVLDTAPVPRR
ncbi:MAG TPA: metallophosphoesterase [Mycobacteriales bacterium]|nr:metallophosphoesterase [Mycobacteriales bacterium]